VIFAEKYKVSYSSNFSVSHVLGSHTFTFHFKIPLRQPG